MQKSLSNNGSAVKTLARGLEILSLFPGLGPELSQSEIAKALGLPLPTVHRLCGTLVSHGFLARDARSRRLRVGLEALRLVGPMLSGLRTPELAREHLRALAAETGETVNLATLDGREVVYLTSVAGNRLLIAQATVGLRVPAHCTALGKCLLAQLDDATVQESLGPEPYERRTERTLTTWAELREALARARRDALVVSDEEYEVGLVSLAVAVASLDGRAPTAINLSLPASRASSAVRDELGRRLRETARAIDAAERLVA